MKKVLLFVLLILSATVAYAQLPWAITDLRCGNGKLDDFEMCEKGLGDGYCEQFWEMLKIDGACDVQHCTCLPRVNAAYCGNNIREGVEVCDGSAEDRCPELSSIMNLSLTCDKKKCVCALNESIRADYDPKVLEALENASGKASVCGDRKVERAEDCDPPDTLCTTNLNDAGICTSKCKCLTPAELAEEENPKPVLIESNVSESNVSESNETEVVNESEVPQPEEKPGFFSRVWAWIVGLFS